MATRTVKLCDLCGTPQAETMNVVYDRTTDASGSTDDCWETVELCAACAVSQVRKMLTTLGHCYAAEWLARVRAKGKTLEVCE